MHKTLVINIMGRDRTGLVESLARVIADSGGNWLESRMCRLGGEFAGILRAEIPKDKENVLITALRGLQSETLTVTFHQDETPVPQRPIRMATLSLVGQDRPGIIYQISSVLAHQNINVEELETECFSAPMSGESTFSALARLQIPDSCAISELRKELEEIGSELMVDLSFTEL